MTVSAAKRQRVYDRDGRRCVSCSSFENLTIGHRINRQMGGSKLRDGFAWLVTQCLGCNVLETISAEVAARHEERGQSLRSWENPLEVAVWIDWAREWRLLDDDGDFRVVRGREDARALTAGAEALRGAWRVDV